MTEFSTRYLADYRAPEFCIKTVNLEVELDDTQTRVTSILSVERQGSHQQPLQLDGEKLLLLSLQLDQQELSEHQYQLSDSQLTIPTDKQAFQLTIVTEINPEHNTALSGLFKSGDAFCTQCEAEGFRRITYYLDRPDVMAVFTCKVIADRRQFPHLLANGNKIASGELQDGKHFATWHDPYPKPCYLFALVAGNFDVLRDSFTTRSGREVQLEIFVDQGNLHKAEHAMLSLQKAMAWDEQTFGLEYDLDIYMIVAVDFFNMGAMENKGLNVFNSKYVLADHDSATDTDYFNIESVIAHEYFHNWTGNRVTCRDWFQLSLKEGLTVFRDQQFSADMHSAAVCRIQNVRVLRSMQFAEDAGPMAHPIRPEKVMEMNNFYTMTVYEKGAEVIRMIHTLLGADKFRQGMDLYFQRFDGMAVTCDDFVNAMADASGIDLSQFKRWYSQVGTPCIEVSTQWQQGKLTLTLHQQQAPAADGSKRDDLHLPVRLELIDPERQSSTSELLSLTESSQSWHFDDLTAKPVLSLLGGFSAPVKLHFEQSDDDLQLIMRAANDEFSRWEAGQQLLIRYIKLLVDDVAAELPQSLLAVFEHVLQSDADEALIADQLTLPSFDEMLEMFDCVEPQALVLALDRLKRFMAQGLSAGFGKVFLRCQAQGYQRDAQAMAQRKLKNVCLSYLALLPESCEQIVRQFEQSDNMTDTLAAMKAAMLNNRDEFERQMAVFENKWQDNTLVMDKWFSMAASLESEDIFERMQGLLQHPLFSLKNPNRARALLGSFAQLNPKYFHSDDGRGYRLLAEQIALLNAINPQVASRLLTPLIQFSRFAPARQQLLKAELQTLRQLPELSKDLLEKLNAALA